MRGSLCSGGLISICKAVPKNTSIHTLDLSENKFNLSALEVMLENPYWGGTDEISPNMTLQQLLLHDCQLNDIMVNLLSRLISTHKSFTSVGLNKNNFSTNVRIT